MKPFASRGLKSPVAGAGRSGAKEAPEVHVIALHHRPHIAVEL